MTCIIGFACPKTKKVYIGGDSAGVVGYSIQVRADEKVFKSGPYIMGFTTSFRMGQLLRYCLSAPEHPDGMDDMAFMVKRFIPAVREVFKSNGFGTTKEAQDSGGAFLVGYRGSIYQIDNDYQVCRSQDNLLSVGCGCAVALGAMHALAIAKPRERITKALEIASHLNAGVRGPFVIEEL